MTIRTIYVQPAFAAEHTLTGLIPYALRLEIGDPGPHLAADIFYKPKLGLTESTNMARWSFAYDSGNGRLAGIGFHDDRPDPESAYDEMAEALERIRDCAKALPGDRAWHHGLMISAYLIAQDWFTRPEEIKAALKPPFPTTPI